MKERGIERLMVEGGGTLNFSLLKLGLVDEICTYIGNMVIGGVTAPTLADGEGLVDDFIKLELRETSEIRNWRASFVESNLVTAVTA